MGNKAICHISRAARTRTPKFEVPLDRRLDQRRLEKVAPVTATRRTDSREVQSHSGDQS
jgi:hypothetical protein